MRVVFEWLFVVLPPNVLIGTLAALLSAFVEIKRHHLSFKDAIMVLALAVATAGAAIEWLGIKWVWVCFLIGLISGRGADSLLQSIDATLPDFADNLVRDVWFYARKILAMRLGQSVRDDDVSVDVPSDEPADTLDELPESVPKPKSLSDFKKNK